MTVNLLEEYLDVLLSQLTVCFLETFHHNLGLSQEVQDQVFTLCFLQIS